MRISGAQKKLVRNYARLLSPASGSKSDAGLPLPAKLTLRLRRYPHTPVFGGISGDPGICNWGRTVGEAGCGEAGWGCPRIRINSLKISTPASIFASRSSLEDASESMFSKVV
jgi:hypothetical protein